MKLLFRDVRADKRRAALQDLDSIARAEVEKALEEIKAVMVEAHEFVVKDWENKPGFGARKYIKVDRMEIGIFPTGSQKVKTIWFAVDQGTKRRTITPKRKPYLRFRVPYLPMTKPRAKLVSGGGKYGKRWVTTKMVKSHRIKPRHFTASIAEDVKPDFKRLVENAFRRAAYRTHEQP